MSAQTPNAEVDSHTNNKAMQSRASKVACIVFSIIGVILIERIYQLGFSVLTEAFLATANMSLAVIKSALLSPVMKSAYMAMGAGILYCLCQFYKITKRNTHYEMMSLGLLFAAITIRLIAYFLSPSDFRFLRIFCEGALTYSIVCLILMVSLIQKTKKMTKPEKRENDYESVQSAYMAHAIIAALIFLCSLFFLQYNGTHIKAAEEINISYADELKKLGFRKIELASSGSDTEYEITFDSGKVSGSVDSYDSNCFRIEEVKAVETTSRRIPRCDIIMERIDGKLMLEGPQPNMNRTTNDAANARMLEIIQKTIPWIREAKARQEVVTKEKAAWKKDKWQD